MWEEGREEVKTWMPRCHCLQLCLDWDFNLRRDLGSRTLLITCQRGMGFLVKLDVSICNMGLIIHELRRLHDLIYVSTQNSIWHCFCCYVVIIIIIITISHSTRNSGLQCLILETVQLNCQLFNFFFQRLGFSQVACTILGPHTHLLWVCSPVILTSARTATLLLLSERLICTF